LGPGGKSPRIQKQDGVETKKDGVEIKKQVGVEETRDGVEIFEKRCWLSLSVSMYFVRVSYMIKKGRCRRVDW